MISNDPKFNLGQLNAYKRMFAIKLSMEKWIKRFGLLDFLVFLSLLDGDPHNSSIVVSLVATMYNIAKGFFGGYLGTLRWPERIRPHHFAIPFNYFVFIMWLKPMEFCLVTKMCSCFKKLSMFSFPQREKEYILYLTFLIYIPNFALLYVFWNEEFLWL